MSGEASGEDLSIPPGTRIGPYVVERFLARGGMGVLLCALDEKLDRRVAIKIIDPRYADDGEFRARFDRECKLVARLRHEHVVDIYLYGEFQGRPYFAMELVEGSSLEKVIQDERRIDWRRGVRWMQQCCKALRAARDKGIIHRDLKPANILLEVRDSRVPEERESIRIVDFGLAKPAQASKDLTMAAMVVGTPHYMSPEQAKGEELDWRSDLYSLGATFFHVFSGRTVFDAPSAMEVVSKHICELPEPLAETRPGLPARLCARIDRLLAKDPAARDCEGYGELRQELQEILDREPVTPEGGETMVVAVPRTAAGAAPPRTLAPGEVAAVSASADTVAVTSGALGEAAAVFPGEAYAWLHAVRGADGEVVAGCHDLLDLALIRAEVAHYGSSHFNALSLPQSRRISRRKHGAFVWSPGGYQLRVLAHPGTGQPNVCRFEGGSDLAPGDYPVGPGSRLDLRKQFLLHLAGSHAGGLRIECRVTAPEDAPRGRPHHFVLARGSVLLGSAPGCGVPLPPGVGASEALALHPEEGGAWVVEPRSGGLMIDDEPLLAARRLESRHLLEGPGFRYRFTVARSVEELNEQ